MYTTKPTNPRSRKLTLGVHERAHLQKLMDGRARIDSQVSQNMLTKPHVRIALEAVLDIHGLTDEQLSIKLKEIIKRKANKSTSKTGTITTNQPSVDANSIQAIRMVWQAKGKFTEKHDHQIHGHLKDMPEEQLDALITQGMKFLRIRKDKIDDRE